MTIDSELERTPTIRETASSALRDLSALMAGTEEANCQVNIVSSGDPLIQNTRCLEMNEELSQMVRSSLLDELRSIVQSAVYDLDGIRNFEFQDFVEGRLYVLNLNRFRSVESWFRKIPIDDEVVGLLARDDHLKKMKFTHSSLTYVNSREVIRLFRKSRKIQIGKKHILFSKLGGTTYHYVDPGDLTAFDHGIDFFIFRGLLYISRFSEFERLLNFREVTKEVASAYFDQLVGVVPVERAQEVKRVILDAVRKMNSLAKASLNQNILDIDMDHIRDVIIREGLPLPIKNVGGEFILAIDPENPVHVQAYLRVLNDAYVRGIMTDARYIGHDKEPF